MSNIPSNYTFEEVLEYYPSNFNSEVLERAYRYIEETNKVKEEIKRVERRIEVLEEQLYFRDEFIGQVLKEAETATKVKELKTYIRTLIDNSYIEL